MAQLTLTLVTFLSSCLLLLSTSSSRVYRPPSHSQLLDVSSALRLTRQVFQRPLLHHDDKTRPSTTATSSNSNRSNSLSLVLRPHISNIASFNNNYTALTLFRLELDQARMARLISALGDEKLEAPVTSGLGQGSGEYFVEIGLGTPEHELSMIIDTGSDISWIQCQPCYNCYPQSDPIFDPSSSSSYQPLPCDSPLCPSDCNGVCPYEVSYGDGSQTSGNLATETMSFGSSGSVPGVAIGCGNDNEGLFAGAAGLMGLGGKDLSFSSQIKASSFSYCFVNRDSDSSSTLDFNSPPPEDSVVAGMIINPYKPTFRYVDFTGVSVAGNPVGIPASAFEIGDDGSGGVIVDSGTTVTSFPKEAYGMVRDAFKSVTQDWTPADGVGPYDTCYDLSGSGNMRVPTVSFHFGTDGTLPLPPGNTVIPVDNAGTFCFAFGSTTGSFTIIGNEQQQGTRVTYDLANKHIAFSLNKC